MKQQNSDYLYYILIFAAAVLQIIIFWQDRSLMIDEANLAINIVEKNYLDFFSSLDYEQYAPPLFLCLEKLMIDLLGNSSFSLRIIPLVSSLCSLVLFYKISNKYISTKLLWFPIIVFSFGLIFCRYATEIKQYSTDVFCLLALLYAFIHYPLNFNRYKNWTLWLIGGMLIIWLSMPVVFILAAIGLSHFLINRKDVLSNGIFYLIFILFWGLSFGLYYVQILHQDASTDLLIDFHQSYFLSFSNGLANGSILLNLLNKYYGHTVLTQILVIISIGSFFIFFRKDKRLKYFLVIILIATFSASLLQKFTLIPRVCLFLGPCFILIVSIGFQELLQKLNNRIKAKFSNANLFYFIPLLILINFPNNKNLVLGLDFENTKSAIDKIQNDLKKELIVMDHLVYPSFYFHSSLEQQLSFEKGTRFITRNWDEAILDKVTHKEESLFYFWFTSIDMGRLEKILKPAQDYYTITEEWAANNCHILKLERNSN